MVQRKVNKLGIQPEHVKSEKLLVSLKPSSSSQHQDSKARGGDLRKKMKKSRLAKRADLESLRSPNFRWQVPQPGKPPPIHVPNITATPQKQSPIKALGASPNYMKSTSSSDAKKERFQVSTRSPQAGSDSKCPSRKNSNSSNHSSAAGQKAARTLVRTSSLKLVKTPSFKPSRASTRKCTPVVLCENLNVQRATCSSTLKDSTFPAYLTLNPGGTESEGTSLLKVCPYTYCSLNGHCHNPLPPLKCFLSARRRMLKAQKTIKLGCLSPRQPTPSGDHMKKIGTGQVTFEGKPALEEPDLDSTVISPHKQEDHINFFIEIYTNDMGNTTDAIADVNSDFCLNQTRETISAEMDITEMFDEGKQNAEDAGVVPPASLTPESPTEILINQQDLEVQSPPIIQPDEPDSEASDMEWESLPYSASYLDNGNEIHADSDVGRGDSLDIDKGSFLDDPIFNSDEILCSCFEEALADEMQKEAFDEESVSSEAWVGDSDTESDGSYQHLAGEVLDQVFNKQSHEQLSPPYYSFKESKSTEEKDGSIESDGFVDSAIILAPAEKPIEDSGADKNAVFDADAETKSNISAEEEAMLETFENNFLQDAEVNALIRNQGPDSSHDFSIQDQDEAYEDCPESQNNIEIYQSDDITEKEAIDEVFDGSLLVRTSYSETNSLGQELPTLRSGDKLEKEDGDAVKSLMGNQYFDLQGFSDAERKRTTEDESHQLDASTKDSDLNLAFVDDVLPADSQNISLDKQSQCDANIEDQSYSGKDEDKSKSFNISNPLDSEQQIHSGSRSLRSAEKGDLDDDKIKMENESMPETEESCFTIKDTSRRDTTNMLFHSESNLNYEQANTCRNPTAAIRCKRPIKESEERRKFNPREPNYLLVEPDPEAEKVDLRHQTMDERKNAEEWMLDYAIQQTVTKLAPVRKRKVALLVEAFETVMPISKFETPVRHTSSPFAHTRPIQACS